MELPTPGRQTPGSCGGRQTYKLTVSGKIEALSSPLASPSLPPSPRFPGKTLKGKKYKPLFEYFSGVSARLTSDAINMWALQGSYIKLYGMAFSETVKEVNLGLSCGFTKSVPKYQCGKT